MQRRSSLLGNSTIINTLNGEMSTRSLASSAIFTVTLLLAWCMMINPI
jgi:hypothetical protein